MKVAMSVPLVVTETRKDKVVIVMGGKTYVLHEGETLTIEFEGSIV